jgi:hypothetical protein
VTQAPDGNDLRALRPDAGAPAWRQYVAPELVEHGTVAKLTQTGGQTVQDFFFFFFFFFRRMSTCL